MAARPFHLGWFLQGSSVQAWGEPWTGHIGTTWMVPELFLDMARSLERACFDYILLEDSSYVGESYNGSTELYLKHGIAVPRQDPSVVASLMTAVTSRIGIVPTFGTYAYPPYLLARLVATLDQVSQGRIGWNAVTGSSDFAAMNFGMKGMPEHDLRYDMADEYMRGGARAVGLVGAGRHHRRPRAAACWSITTKVHAVNHEGRFYKTRGPLNSGPCPQGAAGDRAGRRLAARAAVRGAACRHDRGARQGRGGDEGVSRRRARGAWPHAAAIPTAARCCSWSAPIIGETEADAQERRRMRLDTRAAQIPQRLAHLGQGDQHRFRQVRSGPAAAAN